VSIHGSQFTDDEDGFITLTCTCGFQVEGIDCIEDAADIYGDHTAAKWHEVVGLALGMDPHDPNGAGWAWDRINRLILDEVGRIEATP